MAAGRSGARADRERRSREPLRAGGADVLGIERLSQALPHEVEEDRGRRNDKRDQGHDQPRTCSTGSSRNDSYPPAGSHPNRTAKRMTRRMPSQNCGTTKPTVDSWPAVTAKTRLPRRTERNARSAASGSEIARVRNARLERRDDPFDDGLADGPAALLHAEVALNGLLEPDRELPRHRLVQAEPRRSAVTSSARCSNVRSSRFRPVFRRCRRARPSRSRT